MSNNPAFNLAREEILCDLCRVGKFGGCFFLWQNEPAVILGRFNNIDDEINIKFARENNIKIVRRNSGGGAVYHDLGNVNYSFILHDDKKYNLKFFADIIINALKKIGINGTLEFNHNDLLINNYKFSGMAQYHKDNILLHHGTLLFDSDLGVIPKVLRRASPAKKVMNLKNFLTRDINIQEFMTLLCDIICSQDSIKFFALRDSKLNIDSNILCDNDDIYFISGSPQHDNSQNTRDEYIKFFTSRASKPDIHASDNAVIMSDNSQPDTKFQDTPDYTQTREHIKFFDSDISISANILRDNAAIKSENSQADNSQDTREKYTKFFASRDLQLDKNLCDSLDNSQNTLGEYIKFFASDNIDLCELNNSVNKLMLAKYLNPDWTLKGEYNHDRIQE